MLNFEFVKGLDQIFRALNFGFWIQLKTDNSTLKLGCELWALNFKIWALSKFSDFWIFRFWIQLKTHHSTFNTWLWALNFKPSSFEFWMLRFEFNAILKTHHSALNYLAFTEIEKENRENCFPFSPHSIKEKNRKTFSETACY